MCICNTYTAVSGALIEKILASELKRLLNENCERRPILFTAQRCTKGLSSEKAPDSEPKGSANKKNDDKYEHREKCIPIDGYSLIGFCP